MSITQSSNFEVSWHPPPADAGIHVSVEQITPEIAERYLQTNLNLRNSSRKVIQRYAEDMAAGKWALGTGAIAFDKENRLRDGQHRLEACIRANVAFRTLVVRGVSEDAVDNIDRGWLRSIKDVFRSRGEVNVAQLQAAVAQCWRWDNGYILQSRGPSVQQALGWLEENPAVRDAVLRAMPMVKIPLRIRNSIGAAFVYRTMQIDDEFSSEFCRLLVSGADLPPDSPILRLREAMFLRKPGQRRELDLALMVKAWNAWVTGRSMRQLRFIQKGDHPENFPRLVDLTGKPYPFPEYADE